MVSFYGLDDGLYRERIVFCTETIIGITGFLTKNTHVGQKILILGGGSIYIKINEIGVVMGWNVIVLIELMS